jgi:hypothetical protein
MDSINGDQLTISEEIEQLNQRWADANEKNKELGEGLVVGKVVTFPVADGKAAYEIVEVDDEISYVEHREDLCLDNYHSNAVSRGRIFTDALEGAVRRADFWLNRAE